MYSSDKGIHRIFLKNDTATWIVYQYSPNKNLCLSQEVLLSFAIYDIDVEQTYGMLHVDIFKRICQKSNNEKIMSRKDTDLTIFCDDK